MRKVSILIAALFCVGTAGTVWADSLNPQPLPPGADSSKKTTERVLPPAGTQQIGGNTGNNEDGDSGLHTTDTHEGGKPNPGKPSNQISGNLNGDGKVGLNGDGKNLKKNVATGEHIKKATIQVRKAGGDGGKQIRKAGGENLTLHDQNQISGNLNGDGKTSINGGSGKTGNSLDKRNSFYKEKGFIKGEKGKSKIQAGSGGGAGKTKITGNNALSGNKAGLNFTHGNGTQKNFPGGPAGMGDGSVVPGAQSAH
jgi:hypothetical protein